MTPPDESRSFEPVDRVVPNDAGRPRRDIDKGRRRVLGRVIALAIFVLLALIGAGSVHQIALRQSAQAAIVALEDRVPEVRVLPVIATMTPRTLSLPGNTQPFERATLYARASGYIGEREVDIGSRVKEGDLLATITAPEIDDQLSQARAQLVQANAALDQAEAQAALAQATNQRTAKLVQDGWQTRQQGDQDRFSLAAQRASVSVAQANIRAAQAQVARLEKQQGYERVVAPFDGVITARNVDVGSLVTADSSTGTPLFSIARINVLRVQVYVPQDAVSGVKDGIATEVTVPEMPGRVFKGTVARTADALQADTRTLLVELDVDNADGALTAGLYCTVRFDVPRPTPSIVIPSEALIFSRDGLQVALFDNGTARLRTVRLDHDDGANVSIAEGLQPADQIIVSPPVDLVDGARVQPAPQEAKAPGPTAAR